jgi:hypothetical protein
MKKKTTYKSVLLKAEDFSLLEKICEHEKEKDQPGIVSPGRFVAYLIRQEVKARGI